MHGLPFCTGARRVPFPSRDVRVPCGNGPRCVEKALFRAHETAWCFYVQRTVFIETHLISHRFYQRVRMRCLIWLRRGAEIFRIHVRRACGFTRTPPLPQVRADIVVGMDTILCNISALRYHRIPPICREDFHARLDQLSLCGAHELLHDEVIAGYLGTPLHVLVFDQVHRGKYTYQKTHLWTGEMPPGSLIRIGSHLEVTSPAVTLLGLAAFCLPCS